MYIAALLYYIYCQILKIFFGFITTIKSRKYLNSIFYMRDTNNLPSRMKSCLGDKFQGSASLQWLTVWSASVASQGLTKRVRKRAVSQTMCKRDGEQSPWYERFSRTAHIMEPESDSCRPKADLCVSGSRRFGRFLRRGNCHAARATTWQELPVCLP